MGRPSVIDTWPQDLVESLQDLLRDPRVSQLEATQIINQEAEHLGVLPTSKSGVNRYAVRMNKIGAKLRQSREAADMWINKIGALPQGKVGKLLNEIVRTLAFDMSMAMFEGAEAPEPKDLKELAITLERLERAAKTNAEFEEKIREQAKKEAEEAMRQRVEEASSDGGLDPEVAEEALRILGLG